MTRITCPRCGGKRTITTVVPHMRKSGGVEYRDRKAPDVERLHVCPTCNYAGTVDDADLAAIFARTSAAQLLISDAAEGQ